MEKELSLLIILCTAGRRLSRIRAGESINLDLINLDLINLNCINEPLLINLAREHKTAAALLSGLRECLKKTGETLSPAAMKTLTLIATKEKAMRTFLMEEWDRVEKALTKNNIPMMTIKGPASSIQLYGNPIIREYTDLDIVVQAPDVLQVLPVMENLGYVSHKKKQGFSQPWYMSKPHHLVFIHPNSPYRIEVHNSFFQETKTDPDYQLDNIFQRAETVVYKGAEHTIPSLLDHALLMIEHGTKHAWSQLHWVLDAAAVLSLKNPDFHTALAESISRLGMEKQLALIISLIISLSVSLIRALTSIPIPEVYVAIYEQHAPKITRQILLAQNKLFSRETDHQSISHILYFSWRYTLPLATGIRKKFVIGVRPFLVSPADAQTLPLPGILQPLHLLLRPLFVLSRRLDQSTGLGSCDATARSNRLRKGKLDKFTCLGSCGATAGNGVRVLPLAVARQLRRLRKDKLK